jgi:UDP-GlcNAc:undecaprenyl-phosphate GlcNAc-1-phosphate transferase
LPARLHGGAPARRWPDALDPLGFRRVALTLAAALVGATGLLLWRGPEGAVFFAISAVATAYLIPPVAAQAFRWGMLAYPGGRDIHGEPTPRSGGVALFAPVVAALVAVAIAHDPMAWGLLVGGALVFGVGVIDDAKRASPKFRILVQALAGLCLYASGFRLEALGVPGLGVLELGLFELPVLLFWIVLATNAFNLSDGLDGLATSLALLGLAVLTAAGVPGLLPVAVAGACLGFLLYNLPSARIFLGDSGSLLLGFLLAALALKLPAAENVPLAIAVFAYSLGDVAIVTFRRWIRAKPLFSADMSHVHHKILAYVGGRPLRALIAVLALAGLQGFFAVVWPGLISLTVSACLWLVVAALLIRAGNYGAREVLRQRRLMRDLHLLRNYVLGSLSHATSRERVRALLRHFAEMTELCELSVEDITVTRPGGCPHGPGAQHADGTTNGEQDRVCKVYQVATPGGPTCIWQAAPRSRVLEDERASFVKEAALLAAERMARIDASVPSRASAQDEPHTPPLPPIPARRHNEE